MRNTCFSVSRFRGRDPGAMNVWCKYSSAHLHSRPAACNFWCIPHISGAWEEVALKQKFFFQNIPNNEKNFKVLYKVKFNRDPSQWKSCFSYSDYTTVSEHEISEQFLVVAQFPLLTSCRVILVLSSTSCVKLQIFLLCRSLTTAPKPAADLAF